MRQLLCLSFIVGQALGCLIEEPGNVDTRSEVLVRFQSLPSSWVKIRIRTQSGVCIILKSRLKLYK